MPIKPELRYFYPIDGPQISHWVRFVRAKGHCPVRSDIDRAASNASAPGTAPSRVAAYWLGCLASDREGRPALDLLATACCCDCRAVPGQRPVPLPRRCRLDFGIG